MPKSRAGCCALPHGRMQTTTSRMHSKLKYDYFLYLAFCASESLPHAAPSALPTSPKPMLGFALTILGRCSLQNTMYGPGAFLTFSSFLAGDFLAGAFAAFLAGDFFA